MSTSGHDISEWISAIESMIVDTPKCCVQRAIVLESTPSTMDEAGDETGLLVVALTQTDGRGQRGRQWEDGDQHTLPCTFVVDTSKIESKTLSTLVACAVHETICEFVPNSKRVMIKWPNDIIVRDGDWRCDRKLAGILIEQNGHRAHIGIGINCTQQQKDWPVEMRGNAGSLLETGVQVSRIELVCKLIERLSHWFETNNPEAIRSCFQAHNAMIGTHRVFRVGHKQYEGEVEMIEPFECIVLRTATGTHTLPIAQTQHIRID